MTMQEKTDALKAWFADATLPEGPIPYIQGQVIADPAKFVAKQLTIIEHVPEGIDTKKPPTPSMRLFGNAYRRLYQLRAHLHSCPKND